MMRLADEYEAAQDRGEVQGHGGDRSKIDGHKLASFLLSNPTAEFEIIGHSVQWR